MKLIKKTGHQFIAFKNHLINVDHIMYIARNEADNSGIIWINSMHLKHPIVIKNYDKILAMLIENVPVTIWANNKVKQVKAKNGQSAK